MAEPPYWPFSRHTVWLTSGEEPAHPRFSLNQMIGEPPSQVAQLWWGRGTSLAFLQVPRLVRESAPYQMTSVLRIKEDSQPQVFVTVILTKTLRGGCIAAAAEPEVETGDNDPRATEAGELGGC